MLKKARLLTHPTLAATSPARPESAKTASSPKDAPYPMQGRNSAADPRFTFHGSWERSENVAGGLFNILLNGYDTSPTQFRSLTPIMVSGHCCPRQD